MELKEIRQEIINCFDMFPNKRGLRNKSHSKKYPKGYNRYNLIPEEIEKRVNFKFKKREDNLKKVYEMVSNDTSDFFYTKGLVHYRWGVFLTYKFFNSGLYDKELNAKNSLIKKVKLGEVTDLRFIYNTLMERYKQKNNYVYLLGIKDDDKLFNYKKIGVTSGNPYDRIRILNTSVPFEIYPISIWKINIGNHFEVETYFHRKFSELRKKCEWFEDKNDIILSEMSKDDMLFDKEKVL